MINNKQKVISALKGAKDRVVEKVANPLSYVTTNRFRNEQKSKQSNELYERMKMVNDTPASVNDGGPNKGKPSQLFMARNEMQNKKLDQMNALKKKAN